MMKKTMLRAFAFALVLTLCLSTALTAFAKYDTIPYGERSDRVRRMQAKLWERGYNTGAVDGKFGPTTKAAIIRFQKSVGITADGKPGDKTLTALYDGRSALNKTNDQALADRTNPTNPATLCYGCTGERVKSLQRALKNAGCYGGTIDGVYGELTYQAVRKYQAKRGLHMDGMAGVTTLASLRKTTGTYISKGFTLDVGSSTEEVKLAMEHLRALGYDAPYGKTYSSEMAAVVKAWQADHGQQQTGTLTQKQYNQLLLAEKK